jgi:CheY-like chemotaxis protein
MGPAVLVVDDEPAICDNLVAFLEDEGMLVYTAPTGEDALHRITAGLDVQVCIMDLRLPAMSGTDAILQIHRVAPAVHFVIHTGSAEESVLAGLHENGLGEIPVFRKPVKNMSELAQTVSSLCSNA